MPACSVEMAAAAAAAFVLPGGCASGNFGVEPFGRGLIHDTFLVIPVGEGSPCALLQRLNQRVFSDPARIMANMVALSVAWAGLPARPGALCFPAFFPTRLSGGSVTGSGDSLLYTDSTGHAWRAMTYIAGTVSLTRIETPDKAFELGRSLGSFHETFRALSATALQTVLPEFHSTTAYLAAYERAQVAAHCGHPDHAELEWCEGFISARRALAHTLDHALREGRLTLRVTHGDPKLDNVLFDSRTGKAVALVDLDTVQPGLVLADIGDCLRSACNPAGECPEDIASVRFDIDTATAILRGYASQARLDAGERRLLYQAVRLLPFELGLRFLADHLAGDRYFKVVRPGQNLQRALVQFRLVEDIERQRVAIESIPMEG